jgi:anti-sigma factor RsiW
MNEVVMSCEKMQELMPEVASGAETPSADLKNHLAACGKCAETLKAMRSTMALLDEWNAPEPSAYFDTRLQAMLREEKQKAPEGVFAGVMTWFRKPVLGIATVAVLAFGAAFLTGDRFPGAGQNKAVPTVASQGTAVADLQLLDKQSDLLQDFDALESSPDDDNSSQVN